MAGRGGPTAQVSSRTEAGSGSKRESRFTPRIWRSEPDHQKWPRAPFAREVRIDPLAEPGFLAPPLETFSDEDLTDPAAPHGDPPPGQVGDQPVQRPGGERQPQ